MLRNLTLTSVLAVAAVIALAAASPAEAAPATGATPAPVYGGTDGKEAQASGPAADSTQSAEQQARPGGRADEWLERRRAKMQDLHANESDSMESGLNWLDDSHALQKLRVGWHGLHPVLGGFPSGSGQALGIEWRKLGIGARYPDEHTPNRFDITATAAVTLRGYSLLKTELAMRNVGGSPLNFSVAGGHERNTQEDIYGLGMDTIAENRTNYLAETGGAAGFVWWQFPDWLSVGAGAAWLQMNVAEGTDSRFPDTCTVAPGVPGCDNQPDYLTYEAFVEIDWRNPGNPYRGGFYAFRWTTWEDQDFDQFSFNRFYVDLQQYLPFLKNKRVIALRARAEINDAKSGNVVPFYMLPSLGGNNDLRGFEYARFTDLNSILFQAEYRVEVWRAMDVALFVDAGRVAADRDDLFEDLEVDYGFGFRMKTALSTFMRADFAFGGEAFRFMITFDDVFADLPVVRRIAKVRRQDR